MNLLFNINELKKMLFDFYTLTNIRTAIFDENLHEIASYPVGLSLYCRTIREDPKALKKCLCCDYNSCMMCKHLQSLYIYKCHAGLTEAIVPIQSNGFVMGYIMFGQVLSTNSSNTLWEEISKEISDFNIDKEKLEKAFWKMKNVSMQTIESSAHMLEICSTYLHLSHKVTMKKENLAFKIDNYISEHLKDELSAKILCDTFNIGKTALYELSDKSYGSGIASHVREIRLQRAKELLSDTTMAIYEVADEVGLYDYNYFTKIFKREIGVTPKEYRKKLKLMI